MGVRKVVALLVVRGRVIVPAGLDLSCKHIVARAARADIGGRGAADRGSTLGRVVRIHGNDVAVPDAVKTRERRVHAGEKVVWRAVLHEEHNKVLNLLRLCPVVERKRVRAAQM